MEFNLLICMYWSNIVEIESKTSATIDINKA